MCGNKLPSAAIEFITQRRVKLAETYNSAVEYKAAHRDAVRRSANGDIPLLTLIQASEDLTFARLELEQAVTDVLAVATGEPEGPSSLAVDRFEDAVRRYNEAVATHEAAATAAGPSLDRMAQEATLTAFAVDENTVAQ